MQNELEIRTFSDGSILSFNHATKAMRATWANGYCETWLDKGGYCPESYYASFKSMCAQVEDELNMPPELRALNEKLSKYTRRPKPNWGEIKRWMRRGRKVYRAEA